MLIKLNVEPEQRLEVKVYMCFWQACYLEILICACDISVQEVVEVQFGYSLLISYLYMQVMGLVDIFRAKVVDLSDHTLTVEVKSVMCRILQINYTITRFLILKQSMLSVFESCQR